MSGGAPSYVQNIIIANSITNLPINSIQAFVATGTAKTFYLPAWVVGNSLEVNVVITDSATTNAIANSIYTYLGFNSVLTVPTLTASNTLIDAGQYSTFTVNMITLGGTAPYVANFVISNSITKIPMNTITITSAVPNALIYFPSWYVGNTLQVNVIIVRDTATTNSISNSLYTPLGLLSISNTMLEPGQYSTFTATVSGGIKPYVANFIISNSMTGIPINSVRMALSSNTISNTIYFPSWLLGNTLEANVVIYDSNAVANVIWSGAYIYLGFNGVVNVPTISTISNTMINVGQYSTFTAAVSGGMPPYNAYFVISNTVTKVPINSVQVVSSSPSAVIYFPYWYAGNTLQVNVLIRDSDTTNSISNSIYTPLGLLSISNTMLSINQYSTFTATVSGGIKPYVANFIISNSMTGIPINSVQMTLSSNIISNTIYFPSWLLGNTLEANVVIYDSNAVANVIWSGAYFPLSFNGAMGVPTISITNTVVNANRYSTFTATVSGGTLPYNAYFVISNTVTKVPINSVQVVLSSPSAVIYFPYWYAGNTLQVNVLIRDSATTNSISNSIYTPFGFLSISNTMLEASQYSTFTATVSGGIKPYVANFIISNSMTGIPINSVQMTLSSNIISNTIYFPSWLLGNTLEANVVIYDSNAVANVIWSDAYFPLGFNSLVNVPTFSTISNTMINAGQYSTFTVNMITLGGTAPYVANFVISNTVTKVPMNTISVTSVAPNAVIYFPSWYAGNTLQVNVLIKDSDTTNSISNSLYTPLGFLSISNTIIDAGQYSTFTATVSGGTSPYVANFMIANSVTNAIVNSVLVVSASSPLSASVYFSSQLMGNTLKANTVIYDSSTTNVIWSGAYVPLGFNGVVNTPKFSTISNTLIDAGQYSRFTVNAVILGGTWPYSANFIISNSVTLAPINSVLVTSYVPNAVIYFPSWMVGNTLEVNVVIKDSASFNAIANSIYTYLQLDAKLATPTLTASNTLIDAGQYSTFTVNMITLGGTGPLRRQLRDLQFNNKNPNEYNIGNFCRPQRAYLFPIVLRRKYASGKRNNSKGFRHNQCDIKLRLHLYLVQHRIDHSNPVSIQHDDKTQANIQRSRSPTTQVCLAQRRISPTS